MAVDSRNGTNFDPNAYYGSVGYTFGLDIDQPLSIVRSHYTEALNVQDVPDTLTSFPAYSVSPLWNERGQATDGFFFDGAPLHCLNPNHCVKLTWPAGWFAYARQNFFAASWHGTLIEDKHDKAGTHFRRNRVYDPETGRFTQEDPIRLAGGLNLYSYAGANPVTYADPFGLCPGISGTNFLSISDCPAGYFAGWGAMIGGIAGYIVGKVSGGTGGGLGGEFICAGTPACGIAGAEVGQQVGGRAGAIAGAQAGALAGGLLDLLAMSRSEGKQIRDAIRRATGRNPSDPEFDEMSDEIHQRKAHGFGGTANDKGDFTFRELIDLAKELFGRSQ